MNVFNAVKSSITTRQAAELYGLTVNRKGMCKCPFHEDKNPSMKVDKRFHCFGCQADGDVIFQPAISHFRMLLMNFFYQICYSFIFSGSWG